MLALFFAVVALGAGPPDLPGVAIERRLADRWHLVVGDTIAVATTVDGPPSRFVIAAIYRARPDPATALRQEYRARFHLPDLGDLRGAPDRVDRFAVGVRPGVSADSAAGRLNQLAFGFTAAPSVLIAAESSRTFLVVSRFHRAIGVIAIAASAIFLLCIMLLKIEERRLDAAVLGMIGVSRATIFKAFVGEATVVAAVGSVLGVGLALAAGAVTNLVYRRKFETSLTFSYLTADIVALGVALSLLLGLAVGALAAFRLIRARPLALWRRAG